MLSLSSAKITGLPGEAGWAQVHEFLPEDPEKRASRGHLFAVVATERIEGGTEVISSGRELISRLHEEYFGDLTAKPFNALTSALEKVFSEFRESWGDVEIAACVVLNDVVFSAAVGGAKIVICREGSLATILDSLESVVSASGFPQKGDVMLLGTSPFFKNLSSGVIKAGLAGKDPEAAAESFTPAISAASDTATLGAAIIRFDGTETDLLQASPAPLIPQKTYTEAKNYIGGLLSKVARKFPDKRIYVKEAMGDEVVSQGKKLTFTVAIFLLAILAVSIGFGIRQKRINDAKKQYQGILTEARENVDEAISLAAVSPDKSRELFADSIVKLEQIDALKVKDPKVEELRRKINESRAAILGEYGADTELFLDLSLLSSGFKGDAISVSGGNIYILDKDGKRVVSVVVSTKKSKVVAGPGVIDEAFDLAAYEDTAYVLGSDGIYEIGATKNKVVDKSWDGEAFVKAFAGNLYVLDKFGNSVYRFAGSSSSFGDKQNWLSSSTKADFSDAKSWAIDGAIYVLYPNSRILKYSLGSPQAFRVSGVVPEIGSVDAIYGDPDNQHLYLLDRAGKRVVAIDKSGTYKAQYVGGDIGNATNLVVSEVDKKIILLTGEKLFSAEIKHL